MSFNFVVQQPEGFYFIYMKAGSIYGREKKAGRLLPEHTLLEGARQHFTVDNKNGDIHIFCQDTQGSAILLSYRGSGNKTEGQNHTEKNEWSRRTLIERDESMSAGAHSSAPSVLITPIYTNNGLCLLYNAHDEENMPCLMKRAKESRGQGKWQPPEQIDRFQSLAHAPYEAQETVPGHVLLFYRNYAEGCHLGYREITTARAGVFRRFLSTNDTLADTSFLTTRDALHAAWITKNAFGCQLMYRKKTGDDFSPPVMLWESPKVEQCLLTLVNDSLYIACMIGNRPFFAVSGDGGNTFAPMLPYKRKFCAEPLKAMFVPSADSGADYFTRQVYVDAGAPWDIQMLPDLCADFYA